MLQDNKSLTLNRVFKSLMFTTLITGIRDILSNHKLNKFHLRPKTWKGPNNKQFVCVECGIFYKNDYSLSLLASCKKNYFTKVVRYVLKMEWKLVLYFLVYFLINTPMHSCVESSVAQYYVLSIKLFNIIIVYFDR